MHRRAEMALTDRAAMGPADITEMVMVTAKEILNGDIRPGSGTGATTAAPARCIIGA